MSKACGQCSRKPPLQKQDVLSGGGSFVGIIIAFKVSVKPGVFIIERMFSQPVVILDEANYAESEPKIKVLNDLTYHSVYKDNLFDLYYPKDVAEAVPILFWVHGGGFVSGDKEGVKEFATYIAANNKVAVVAMNYETAPHLQYPGQVRQMDELYRDLFQHQADYPMLDFSTLLFGGDSAGAQISGQYVAIQTNELYADEMKMEQAVTKESIRGFISYSGPIDLQQMATLESDDACMKFFINTVARALIGTKNWKDNVAIKQGSVKEYVTEDFPSTYITDGNSFSFQDQGMAFVEKLESLHIPVQSLFFNDVEKEITHEYQFNYVLEEAKESLQQTIDFIDRQLEER